MMALLGEGLLAALLVLGGGFGMIGSYGLLRLRGAMQRLHAPSLASTMGLGSVLIASCLHALFTGGEVSWHEVLITLFVFLTAPLTAIYLAKTLLHHHIDPASLPGAGKGKVWPAHPKDGSQ